MSFDESKSISLSFIAYCWLLLGIALGFGGMIIPGILALICYLILSRVFPRFPFELRVVSSISTAKALFIVTAILLNLLTSHLHRRQLPHKKMNGPRRGSPEC